MPAEPVSADTTPPARGHYSAATLSEGSKILEVAGQLPEGPDGQLIGGDDPEAQARQCLKNIDDLVRAVGAQKSDIARIGVFLTSMADRAAVARAREEYFGDHKPSATLFQVAALVSPEFKVEIEATVVF
jgi:enamine deaminase RidA (YjgF/YER057c/UK114 family)